MKFLFSLLTLGCMALSTAHADTKILEQNLKQNFPDNPVKSIQSTPFKDIYEVFMGGKIVYTTEEGKYFFVGNLIDLKQQKNITEEREQILTAIDVKTLPLDQAIKHVKGKGERIIYLFSDPDCPYCQKFEKELKKVDNITIYLFLYPIKNLHPHAEDIAQKIWCSKDQYQTWQDYLIEKKQPPTVKSCETPIQKNIALAKKLEVDGTPTFFLENGARISGAQDAEDVELLLKQFVK